MVKARPNAKPQTVVHNSKMKIRLTDRIIKLTELPLEEVDTIFQNGISDSYKFFPTTIMYGTMVNGRIDALINPPKLIADPFQSRVKGEFKRENELTKIDLKINLSWLIIVFGILWYIPILIATWGLFTNEQGHVIERIIWISLFSILPIGFSTLKLNWDKVRLENWIEERIRTEHNSTQS